MFCDALEVSDVRLELQRVAIHDEEFAGVVLYPGFVALVQAVEVVDAYALLVVATAFGDLRNEVGDAAAYLDEQVWQPHERHH